MKGPETQRNSLDGISGRQEALRLFLAAVCVYIAGTVVGWVLGTRFGWLHPAYEIGGYVIAAANCLTFILVSARLAVTMEHPAVLRAALVSSGAVLAWGWIRTALAANGTWQLLQWDHQNVIFEAAIENVWWAVWAFLFSVIISVITLPIVGREESRGR
jgi:hypothetical protein